MRRFVVGVTLVLASFSVAQAQTVSLALLGLGPIYGVEKHELDGAPGAEYIVKIGNPLGQQWIAVYPQQGMCKSAPFVRPDVSIGGGHHAIDDFDGDGREEMMHFDLLAQTVTFILIPPCTN